MVSREAIYPFLSFSFYAAFSFPRRRFVKGCFKYLVVEENKKTVIKTNYLLESEEKCISFVIWQAILRFGGFLS